MSAKTYLPLRIPHAGPGFHPDKEAKTSCRIFVRAEEAVPQLVNVRKPFPGSAGVPPAKLLESMPRLFFIHAGKTAALPGWQPSDSLFSPDPPDVSFLYGSNPQ